MNQYHETEVRLRNLEVSGTDLKALIDKQAALIANLLELNEALNARVDALAQIVCRIDGASTRRR